MVASGAVAQLGEHLICIQGVVGSNPISSTTSIRVAGGVISWHQGIGGQLITAAAQGVIHDWGEVVTR